MCNMCTTFLNIGNLSKFPIPFSSSLSSPVPYVCSMFLVLRGTEVARLRGCEVAPLLPPRSGCLRPSLGLKQSQPQKTQASKASRVFLTGLGQPPATVVLGKQFARTNVFGFFRPVVFCLSSVESQGRQGLSDRKCRPSSTQIRITLEAERKRRHEYGDGVRECETR